MSTDIKGRQLRRLLLGTKVEKAAAVLPATATTSYFSITGGRVIITSFTGVCTTVCTSTATTVAVGTTPTTGTASTTSVASATAVTSKEVGTMVGLGATAGAALIVGSNAASPVVVDSTPIILSAGTIDITTSATNTGAFKWTLTYIPLDEGASVAAL